MTDNVSFREIQDDRRAPGVIIEIGTDRADTGLPALPHRMVIFGQKLSSGNATPNVETQIFSASDALALGGRGSLVHQMAIEVFKGYPTAKVTVVVAADLAGSAAATGTITVSGTAQESGVIPLYIDGTRVQIGVTKGDTAAVVAGNIATQINVNGDLPLTVPAAQTGAVVTMTARHKGETGNELDARAAFYAGEKLPAGIALAFSGMSGGVGNPDVGPLLGAIRGKDRLRLVCPYIDSANLAAIEADFADRYTAAKQQESHVFGCVSGSYGTYNTFLNGRNSLYSSFLPREGNMLAPWRLAARAAALAAKRGASDPARPYTDMEMTGIPAPAEADRFDENTKETLLRNGGSSFRYGDNDGTMRMEIVATTYKTTSAGAPTKAYYKLQSKWGADYFRFSWRNMILTKFPDYKLANDGTNYAAGQAIVTPKVLTMHTIALLRDLEFAGQIENVDQTKAALLMLRSSSNVNQVNAVVSPDLVNQFDIFAARVLFIN